MPVPLLEGTFPADAWHSSDSRGAPVGKRLIPPAEGNLPLGEIRTFLYSSEIRANVCEFLA